MLSLILYILFCSFALILLFMLSELNSFQIRGRVFVLQFICNILLGGFVLIQMFNYNLQNFFLNLNILFVIWRFLQLIQDYYKHELLIVKFFEEFNLRNCVLILFLCCIQSMDPICTIFVFPYFVFRTRNIKNMYLIQWELVLEFFIRVFFRFHYYFEKQVVLYQLGFLVHVIIMLSCVFFSREYLKLGTMKHLKYVIKHKKEWKRLSYYIQQNQSLENVLFVNKYKHTNVRELIEKFIMEDGVYSLNISYQVRLDLIKAYNSNKLKNKDFEECLNQVLTNILNNNFPVYLNGH